MLEGKKILAVIPARGGSKRLPGKNTKLLNGKPLIGWSIEAALGSKYIDKVIVSTDCAEISILSEKLGAEVPFNRPIELSGDNASTNGVVLHALAKMQEKYDYIVILQPTSPLRNSSDIDAMITELYDKDMEGIVSVCPCEHSPLWSNILPNDMNMGSFIPNSVLGKRSQDLSEYFRLNGSVYAFDVEKFIKQQGIFYTEKVLAFRMPVERSVDIDTITDFYFAEYLLIKNT